MNTDQRQLARTQGRFAGESDWGQRRDYSGSHPRRQMYEDSSRRDSDEIHHERKRNQTYSGSKSNERFRKSYPKRGEYRHDTWRRRRSDPGDEQQNLKYVENDLYKFGQLEDRKQEAKEIDKSGVHILSQTENGESRVYYYPSFLDVCTGYSLLTTLKENTEWYQKDVIIDGVRYPQPRLVAWYGPLPYSYSGVTLPSREFPPEVMAIKIQVEQKLKSEGVDVELNSVLLNLYRDNRDSVAWHSDDELSMGICPTIASVSIGEKRRFEMRRKSRERLPKDFSEYVVHLKHGSLIVMDGVMQLDWEHRVPKEYHNRMPRINLTFRTVYAIDKVKRPMRIQESVENSSKSKLQISQEPFSYQEENFPSLGSAEHVSNVKDEDNDYCDIENDDITKNSSRTVNSEIGDLKEKHNGGDCEKANEDGSAPDLDGTSSCSHDDGAHKKVQFFVPENTKASYGRKNNYISPKRVTDVRKAAVHALNGDEVSDRDKDELRILVEVLEEFKALSPYLAKEVCNRIASLVWGGD